MAIFFSVLKFLLDWIADSGKGLPPCILLYKKSVRDQVVELENTILQPPSEITDSGHSHH